MTAEQILDAEVVPEEDVGPAAVQEPPSTQLVRRERRSEVIKPLDTQELAESFKAYQDLLPRLLDANDWQEARRGKRFVKKSGWRKIATAFDLDVQMIRSQVERDEDGQPTRAEVWARAIAPSGRSMDGDGYCSVDEERFSGPRGNKSKLENDLRATATTRAMNRAISGLVGMGDVSAEEVDASPDAAHDGPPFGPPASPELLASARKAAGRLLGVEADAAPVTDLLTLVYRDAGDYLPQVALRALCHVAQRVKRVEGAGEEEVARAEKLAAEHQGTVGRPAPGSVDPPALTGKSEEKDIEALTDAGCCCPDPLGVSGHNADCPIRGHGIPAEEVDPLVL